MTSFALGTRRVRAATLALAMSALIVSAPTSASAADRPNIVLVLADDLGWMDLGVQGSAFYETPHIDALAERGVRFSDFYAASPLCSPTRASLLTGQSPARLKLTKAILGPTEPPGPGQSAPPTRRTVSPIPWDRLRTEWTTIAERLREAGYATAHVGKWHLGPRGNGPEHHGFQVNVAGDHYPTPPSYFPPYRIENLADGPPGEYLTDRITDEAIRFMEAHRDRPFFLYLSHFAVHGPWQSKPELVARYRAKAEASAAQRNPVYAGMIQSLDESVGRIVASLAALGLTDRTLLIFVSDNGAVEAVPERKRARADGIEPGTPITSNAPLRDGKGSIHEGGIRVPAIVVWPGEVPAGGVSAAPSITTDLYPTILAAAGLAPRDGAVLDGVSLLHHLRGGAPPERDALYFHFPHLGDRSASAIRSGDLKLIRFYEGDEVLYDLSQDPGEQRDIADEQPKLAANLAERLTQWLETTDAQIPSANPGYRPPGPEGWQASRQANLRVEAGALRMESETGDATLTSPDLEIKGPARLRLRIRSTAAGNGSLRWATPDATRFEESPDVRFPLRHDDTWQEVAVPITAEGPIERLRLRPAEGPGAVRIDWLRIEDPSGANILREWRFDEAP